ncbi:MAG TPA: bacteriohopanetetrol glucosamine biosynthesis glycosyltransferase HpnI [Bryobacterales bacterium]|nr:bacteriohopanetetrol glucosamine biosynthesis glycosyltransferase HpnI [Bryobacterales bacterium]
MRLPELVLLALLAVCSLYHLAALLAALGRARPRPGRNARPFTPPVSVLKPVRGLDPDFYAAIRSHAAQDYPEFELLFAVRDPADPAVGAIRRLAAEFPQRRIDVFFTSRDYGANAKVNSLERLRAECRYDILVINDSDILAGPDYLRRVVAPLEKKETGLVTCLYRGVPAGGLASVLEGLWISTDFQPGVLVARALGMRFALGATMALRRADLEQIGGFAPLADYLADDYQLGKAITARGFDIALSDCVVETMLPRQPWAENWRHRLRWGRTLRVCRPAGYAGMAITFAVPIVIAAVALQPSLWPEAMLCLGLRAAAAIAVGCMKLRDRAVVRYFLLIPLADLASFAVWAASLFGRRVVWRSQSFRLQRGGRLAKESS